MTLLYPMFPNGRYCLKNEDFDDIASMVLGEYLPDSLVHPQKIDIDYLVSDCYYLDVIKTRISKEGNILGMMVFEDTVWTCYDASNTPVERKLKEATMVIDSSLSGEESLARTRFTMAHEMSHWICHRSLHSSDKRAYECRKTPFIACRDISIEGPQSPAQGRKRLYTVQDWEEWQANRLAASLLMPKNTFTQMALQVMEGYGIEGGKLDLHLLHHFVVAKQVVSALAHFFQVSRKATKIRMRQLGLLVEMARA